MHPTRRESTPRLAGPSGGIPMNEKPGSFSRRDFVKGGSVLLGGLAASAAAGAGETAPPPVKVPDIALGRTGGGSRGWGSAAPTSSGSRSPRTTSAPRCIAPWNSASTTWTRRRSTATPRPASPRRRWARRSPRSATRSSSSPRPRSRPTRGPGSCCDRASSGCGPTGWTWSTCTTSATRSSGATASWSSATTAPWPRCGRRSGRASSGSSGPAGISTRRGSTRCSTAARSTS